MGNKTDLNEVIDDLIASVNGHITDLCLESALFGAIRKTHPKLFERSRDRWYNYFSELKGAALIALAVKDYVYDNNFREFVHIPSVKGNEWIRQDQFGKDYYTKLPVEYVVAHLGDQESRMFNDKEYNPERSDKMRVTLDSGISSGQIHPIRVVYYAEDMLFFFTDGIHRLQVFHERKISYINSYLGLFWGFQPLVLCKPSNVDLTPYLPKS